MADPRVAMSAACKLAAETGEAWVSWRGERLKLGRLELAEGGKDAVIVNRGQFYVVTLIDKDGLRVELPARRRFVRIQWEAVRAVVLERHRRTP